MEAATRICKACYHSGEGDFCSACGQSYKTGRITFKSLVKEVIHFFTHLDKGFVYTLKQLIQHPGGMQREYIRGNRVKHQKPFAMYFVCATMLGLFLYWLNLFLSTYLHSGNLNEGFFFHKYMVLFLLLAIPLSAVITYLIFWKSEFNFAEIGVFQLYTVSMFFMIVILANLTRLIWPEFQTRFIELPVILIYNTITCLKFFSGKKLIVAIKSIVSVTIFFLAITYLQDFMVQYFSHESAH